MKRVVKDDEVARLWVEQTQDEARNNGGTFWYRGDTIYSYGRHFPIARHVTHNGLAAVLLTTRGYSNTTAVQIGYVRSKLSGRIVFDVPDPSIDDHTGNPKSYVARAESELLRSAKAIRDDTREHYQFAAERIVKQGNAYASFFGCLWRLEIDGSTVEVRS